MIIADTRKFDSIVEFIENHKDIKLYDYQKKILKYIVDGNRFSAPVHSGRKTILNGYIAYLQAMHGKHIRYEDSEMYIDLEEVILENNWMKDLTVQSKNMSQFNHEYEQVWTTESK